MDKNHEKMFSKGDIHRYIKICSISLVTKEMQIKTTMRYHLELVRKAIIKKRRQVLERIWRKGWECKLEQPQSKREWKSLEKLNIELGYDPLVLCLRK